MTNRDAVTAIIVNYNGADHLGRCIAGLLRQTRRPEILVVDNASSDGSARTAFEQFPEISVLPLRRNTGFARAVNIAARYVTSEFIVLVNPDTETQPEFVERLIEPLSNQPHLASTAATLVFASRPDVIASAGIAVHRNGVAVDAGLGEPVPSQVEPVPVFGASGGAAAYRHQAFITAGGFAESFFMYLEDVDLAWRLRLLGWESAWAPGAVAQHAYSASAGEGSPFKRRLLARNRIWSIARSWPDELLAQDCGRIVLHDLLATSYGIARWDTAALRGRAEALIGLPIRLCERRSIQRSRTGNAAALSGWVRPSISPLRLISLRRLTAELATHSDP